jgi:uncharacterized membrane protein (UPF0127 family)
MDTRLARLPVRRLPGGALLVEARTPLARLRGLAGLPRLPPGRALLLPGCRSVHTLGMRFALDLVWLDGAGRVLRVDAAVPPRRVRTCRAARAVVETAAGGGAALAAQLEAASLTSASAGVPPEECSSSVAPSSGGWPI